MSPKSLCIHSTADEFNEGCVILQSWQVQAASTGGSGSEQDALNQRGCSCKASSAGSSQNVAGSPLPLQDFKRWGTASLPSSPPYFRNALGVGVERSSSGSEGLQEGLEQGSDGAEHPQHLPCSSCSPSCALCSSTSPEPPKLHWQRVPVMGVEAFAEIQCSNPWSVNWDMKFLEVEYLSVLFSWQNVLIKESHLVPT